MLSDGRHICQWIVAPVLSLAEKGWNAQGKGGELDRPDRES